MGSYVIALMPTKFKNGDGIKKARGNGEEPGVLTAPAWPSSAWARAGTSDRQGVEAPWPLASAQKGTQRK